MKRKSEDEWTEVIDYQIDQVFIQMARVGPESEDYPSLLSYLERLDALKNGPRPERVSRDTIAIVIGNLVGVVAILSYEHTHALTSKALSLLIRPRTN